MGYLILGICVVYTLLWGAGLLFAVRSDGKRALWIPALGLLLFIAGSAQSAIYLQEALANPPQLTEANYNQVKEGMSPDEVAALFGPAEPEEREFNLQSFSVVYPREISGRLRGDKRSPAQDARMVIKIIGEPGEVKRRNSEGLAAPATYEGGGVVGLQIALIENGNEVVFTEGEEGDWKYEDNMTAEDVAKTLGDIIDAHPSWIAEGSPEDAPTSINIAPELEENKASTCNEVCTARVVSEETIEEEPKKEGEEPEVKPVATGAVKVRGVSDGTEQKFSGGQDEAYVQFWHEDGILMDHDFGTGDRLVIVGFIADKVVGKVQSGIDITAPPAEATADAE